jgi:hypothetical protein
LASGHNLPLAHTLAAASDESTRSFKMLRRPVKTADDFDDVFDGDRDVRRTYRMNAHDNSTSPEWNSGRA